MLRKQAFYLLIVPAMRSMFSLRLALLLTLFSFSAGCRQEQAATIEAPTAENKPAANSSDSEPAAPVAKATPPTTEDLPIDPPAVIEIQADSLLAAQLEPSQLEEGWVRLFDGQSLFGWFVVGTANWQIADGIVQVSRGERSYLCTSFQLPNYEFKVDFRSDAETNSGIFLRTGPQPEDVATTCLELNIAPPDNPFPTGSFVQRKKVEPEELGQFDPTAWHTYHVRLVGNHIEVLLDDKLIIELDDFEAAPTGHISLQHNEGKVEFRNIMLRPINLTPLKLDEQWQKDWTLSEKEPNTFTAEVVDDGMRLVGGLGQLQTKDQFGDFFLQACYTLDRPEVNTGIFFRCVPDAMLDGYECQVNHATADGDPLQPIDAGAGAIFRRQPARIVIGDGTNPTYITLLANGPHMVTWVNGVQVADFYDTREPDENPRKGLRLAPGPIALQGHDGTTAVTFHSLSIGEL
jgi:hypothetical protein